MYCAIVARQPAHADRQLLLQRQINGHLRREAADPRASLERLANAIDDETWDVARELGRVGGERSCINVSGLLLERGLLAIMDISARAISLAERPQRGHLGHQCSHTPGRPNLHLV